MDAFIREHLHGVSRTYALVIPMLPRPLDESVGLAYLLMRIVDTVEDATELNDATRRELLGELARSLADPGRPLPPELTREIGDKDAERRLMSQSSRVLERVRTLDPADTEAVHHCARQMCDGVVGMLDRSARRGWAYPGIADADELRQYCYYVAGVVGEMLCALMARHLRLPALLRLRELAVELGIGLQLVNILKDALSDARHGRRYLPVVDGERVDPGQVTRAVLDEARSSLARGVDFVLALPAAAGGLRLFCGLPIAWGAMTLSRAERDARRAKIDRSLIQGSIERFQSLLGNDSALGEWLRGLLRPGSEPARGL